VSRVRKELYLFMKTIFCYQCDKDTIQLAASLAFMRTTNVQDNDGRPWWDRGGPAWVCAECGEVIRALPAEQFEWLKDWFMDPPGVDSWGKLREPMPRVRDRPERHKDKEP